MNQENFEGDLAEGYAPPRVINFPRRGGKTERVVSRGRTGRDTGTHRLVDPKTGKATEGAREELKKHTAGPKGRLPDWTEYQRIGALIAEALGLGHRRSK